MLATLAHVTRSEVALLSLMILNRSFKYRCFPIKKYITGEYAVIKREEGEIPLNKLFGLQIK